MIAFWNILSFICLVTLTSACHQLPGNRDTTGCRHSLHTLRTPIASQISKRIKNDITSNNFDYTPHAAGVREGLLLTVESKTAVRLKAAFGNKFDEIRQVKYSNILTILHQENFNNFFLVEIFYLSNRTQVRKEIGRHAIFALVDTNQFKNNTILHIPKEKLRIEELTNLDGDQIYEGISWLDFDKDSVWLLLTEYREGECAMRTTYFYFTPDKTTELQNPLIALIDLVCDHSTFGSKLKLTDEPE